MSNIFPKFVIEKNKITRSDKLLGTIAAGMILFVGYNIFGEYYTQMIHEFLKHLFL